MSKSLMKRVIDKKYRSPNRSHHHEYFYKYVTADVAKIILTTRTIRWSSPLLFDDPFDVSQELRLNFNETELNNALVEELARHIENGDSSLRANNPVLESLLEIARANGSSDIRKQIAEEFRQGTNEVTIGQVQAFQALKKTWADIVPKFRILCLSEFNDIPLMWERYCDSDRGVVLRFNCLDEIDSALLVARQVKYQDESPNIASKEQWAHCVLWGNRKNFSDLFREYEYIKTNDWAYQKEWRIVTLARSEESGLFSDYPFRENELSEIYLGSSCSKSDEQEIRTLLGVGFNHVSVSRGNL